VAIDPLIDLIFHNDGCGGSIIVQRINAEIEMFNLCLTCLVVFHDTAIVCAEV
jgi:hypothetical protein